MKLRGLVHWLQIPRNLVITTSAGVLTVLAAVFLVHSPRVDSSWVKVKSHTFRHAVIDDGINSRNCMSGPWNECVIGRRVKKGSSRK